MGYMKLLVATEETQGKRKNDFCFVPEGEIVMFGFECDGETVDGGCGCRRSMVGLKCYRGTTTMKIVDVDITEKDLKALLMDCYCKAWKMSPMEAVKEAEVDGNELMRFGEAFPAGVIVEKRGRKLQERRI
jgi:hypothetical protein